MARAAFSTAIVVGSFHEAEHIAQVVQRYLLDIPNGSGLLGNAVDIEPLHLVYNLASFMGLMWVARSVGPFLRRDGVATWCLQFALTLQLWHVFEHYLKFAQYLALGFTNGTGGVFGAGPGGYTACSRRKGVCIVMGDNVLRAAGVTRGQLDPAVEVLRAEDFNKVLGDLDALLPYDDIGPLHSIFAHTPGQDSGHGSGHP